MIRPVQKDLYAVIGNPVGHSLSPAMMNAAFHGLAIPAVYLALEADAIEDDLETLAKTGLLGLSVTLPHKESAFRLAASVDETAKAIGAVNTLRRRAGGWEGCNTDWLGAVRPLREATPLDGKRALVIGAGGAARGVLFGLKREGALTTVANRSIERGEALASAFRCDFLPLAQLERASTDFDVIVQCTSLGLKGKEASSPVPPSFFRPGMVVMDTVYRPLWTPFLRSARQAGCTTIFGLEMLLHQGVAQLEWWLGEPVPHENGTRVMRDALMKALENE